MAPKPISVSGHATISENGVVNLQLVPNQPTATTVHVPTYEHVISLIHSGVIDIHLSRMPLTKNDLIIAIRKIQARFAQSSGQLLVTGWGGWWSEAAWDDLRRWLAGVKRSRSQSSQPMLALPAPAPMLALLPPPPRSPTSSSTSTTSSDECGDDAPQEEVEEAAADNEEDGGNDEDAEDAEDEEDADEEADNIEDVDGAEDVSHASHGLTNVADLAWTTSSDWEDLSTCLAYIADGVHNDDQKALWELAVSSLDKIHQAQRR